MKYEDQTLKDFIFIQEKFIPRDICNYVISNSEKNRWELHRWGDSEGSSNLSYYGKEPKVQHFNKDIGDILFPFVKQSLLNFQKNLSFCNSHIFYNFSPIRMNKYGVEDCMRIHFDHIHSVFDSGCEGIPVLSVIINLNDDYDGGELVFWKRYEIKLGCGDIVIFPSLFMFPHQVNKIKEKFRYSAVCWVW